VPLATALCKTFLPKPTRVVGPTEEEEEIKRRKTLSGKKAECYRRIIFHCPIMERRMLGVVRIMLYQRGGTVRGDVTCHVRRDRTLLIGVKSKASKFPAGTGRGKATKWLKLQVFITF
jgi:hypothetical protein